MRKAAIFLSAMVFCGAASVAEASTITYVFSVKATSGALAGNTASGTFSYDSSSIIPGGSNLATNLLTDLNFTWDGITYDETSANTGWLGFYPNGGLFSVAFGNNCYAGGCIATSGSEQWFVDSEGDSGFMAYSTVAGGPLGGVYGGIAFVDTPEPLTLSLVGMGFAGAVAGRRRARRDKPA